MEANEEKISEEMLVGFLQETAEILQSMEDAVLAVLEGSGPDGAINDVFRAFHTLKGSAGTFGYGHIGKFSHNIESYLAELREMGRELDAEDVEFLLNAKDRILEMLRYSEEEYERRENREGQEFDLLQNLKLNQEADSQMAEEDFQEGESPRERVWQIRLELDEALFRSGIDPYPVIRYLAERGRIEKMRVHPYGIPLGAEFDPELCYIRPEFEMRTRDDKSQLRDSLSILGAAVKVAIEEIEKKGKTTPPSDSFDEAKAPQVRPRMEGESAAIARPLHLERDEKNAPESLNGNSLRIEASRLDALINQIGELVVAGVQLGQAVGEKEKMDMAESVDQMVRVIADVRESAMRLRMVPVRNGFRRFKRLVHDLSRDLGKPVQMHLEGEDSELDRTVMEKITDPLLHILRNAMDHGIESMEERLAAGKSETGNIWIRAYHSTGEIVIEIRDDGRGISRARVRKKAEELGLIPPGRAYEGDPLELIFEPGLTTASSLTSVSGRGVGMDVVRRNIESLRGSVDVETEEKKGTLFRIRLPLTLATIEGLHVMAGGVHCVLSLDQVLECYEYNDSMQNSEMIRIRDEAIPRVDLNRLLGLPVEDDIRRFMIIVISGGKKVGIVVDHLMGQIQSVVRPLRGFFALVGAYSGFTLLGDGTIAMILHIAGIVAGAMEQRKKEVSYARIREDFLANDREEESSREPVGTRSDLAGTI